MMDPCECCSVPVDKIWLHELCLGCWANEQSWKRPSVGPCFSCPERSSAPSDLCATCPVTVSPDDIFANDLKQMSWEDYLADMAKEREELINE